MAYTILANLAAGNQPLSIIDANFAQAALLASPAFTGVPTAPTAAGGTNTNQLATTAFVEAAVGASPTSWTPSDQSGASLTFTSVSANYVQNGNMVNAYGTLTYPGTADGSTAAISLPVAVPNQNYAQTAFIIGLAGAGTTGLIGRPVKATSKFNIIQMNTGVASTNAQLANVVMFFNAVYPAT